MNKVDRERLKQRAMELKSEKPVDVAMMPKPWSDTPPESPPPKPAPPQKVKPPVVALERVVLLCGHQADFEIFPDKQDKFRAERRAKLAGKLCPECRQKANAEREAAERAAAEVRRREKGPKPRRDAWKKQAEQTTQRLPHGSKFDVAFDAVTVTWAGTLEITAPPEMGGKVVFGAVASGVFRLLSKLDEMYRKSLTPAAEGANP